MVCEKVLQSAERKIQMQQSHTKVELAQQGASFRAVKNQIKKNEAAYALAAKQIAGTPKERGFRMQGLIVHKQKLADLVKQKTEISSEIQSRTQKLSKLKIMHAKIQGLQDKQKLQKELKARDAEAEESLEIVTCRKQLDAQKHPFAHGVSGSSIMPIGQITVEGKNIEQEKDSNFDQTHSPAVVSDEGDAVKCAVTTNQGKVIELTAHLDALKRVSMEMNADSTALSALQKNRGNLLEALKKERVKIGEFRILKRDPGDDERV